MKTYKQLLSEAKDRFFKKNSSLTFEQEEELIDAVKKYKKFEKLIADEIGWNKVSRTSYYKLKEILNRAMDSKTSRAKKARKLRHKGIKGLVEGDDYLNIKTKNPYYLTYIPLHYKAAQTLKTAHIGGCIHDGCIGASQAPKYFRLEGKKKDRVPVYVIGMGEKYVVMMYRDGKHETWRKENKVGEKGEMIPNFSIKKELATPKLKKLYANILDVNWGRKGNASKATPEEYAEAMDSYESMVADIEHMFGERIQAREYHEQHNQEVYERTIEEYKEKIEEIKNEIKDLRTNSSKLEARLAELKLIIKTEPTGTGTNDVGDIVWNLRGVDYTLDDLMQIHKDTMTEVEELEDENELEDTYDKLKDHEAILEKIESFEYSGYEFEEWAGSGDADDVDFYDDVYSSDYMFEGVYSAVNFGDAAYDEYFEFAERFLDVDSDEREDLHYNLYDMESEISYQESVDGEAVLDDLDLPNPEEAGR